MEDAGRLPVPYLGSPRSLRLVLSRVTQMAVGNQVQTRSRSPSIRTLLSRRPPFRGSEPSNVANTTQSPTRSGTEGLRVMASTLPRRQPPSYCHLWLHPRGSCHLRHSICSILCNSIPTRCWHLEQLRRELDLGMLHSRRNSPNAVVLGIPWMSRFPSGRLQCHVDVHAHFRSSSIGPRIRLFGLAHSPGCVPLSLGFQLRCRYWVRCLVSYPYRHMKEETDTRFRLASAEMHSVRLRTYGQASSATVYQIFGFAATFWTPYMLQPQYGNWGTNVGYFYFAVNAVSFALTFLFVPETANLTLEQIDEYFMSGVPAWRTSIRKNKLLAKGY